MKWYVIAEKEVGGVVTMGGTYFDSMQDAWNAAMADKATDTYDNVWVIPGADPAPEPEDP